MHFTTENEELLLLIVNNIEGDNLLRFNSLLLDEVDKYAKNYQSKKKDVNQNELLLSAICQFTNRNTQKEILEVDEWLKTDFIK